MSLRGIGCALAGASLTLLAVCVPGRTQAAPDGRPRAVPYLGDLGAHDPAAPVPGFESWTPVDVVQLLGERPHASVSLGREDGLPPGNTVFARRRQQADPIQALAGSQVSDRLCVPFRVDTHRKLPLAHPLCDPARGGGGCDWEGDMDGSLGESETVVKARGQASGGSATTLASSSGVWAPGAWTRRLLVVRPGSALEERRRIQGNDAATLHVTPALETPPRAGDAFEIRGSFDPGWVMRVATATHDDSMRRFWGERRNLCGPSRQTACGPPAEPLDPLATGNRRGWSADLDRAAIAALATPSEVPALYGTIRDADPAVALTDPYPRVDSVVMDLRNPAYRQWRIRSLLYALEDQGIAPGDGVCVLLSYEPALHAYHDEVTEGPSTDACALPGTSSWQGPLHVCAQREHEGGPLDPTRYGPGEFEAGLSGLVRELLDTLPRHGYESVRIVTAEREAFRSRPWTTLDADLRFDARLVGELGRADAPLLASVWRPAAAGAASDPETDDGDGTGGGAGGKSSAAKPRPLGLGGFGRAPETSENGKGSGAGARRPGNRGSSSWTIGSPRNGSNGPRKGENGAPDDGDGGRPSWKPVSDSGQGTPGKTNGTPGPKPVVPKPVGGSPPANQPVPVDPAPTTGGSTTAPRTPTPDADHHPNEPAGMAPRWPTNPMNTLPSTNPDPPDRYGYKCWEEQCRTLSIVRDPTSPGSDPDVMRVGFPKGHPGGHPPSRFLAGHDFGGKRRLYTSVYYFLSPNWTNGGNTGTKFFFTRANTDGVQNHFVGGPTWEPPYTTGFFLQTRDGAGNRNIAGGRLPTGRWVLLEVYIRMNTPGVPDGVAKLWIDGDLAVDVSDVEWVEGLAAGQTLRDVGWGHLWVDPTYGGGSNPVPEDMYFQIDDWYTSVGD